MKINWSGPLARLFQESSNSLWDVHLPEVYSGKVWSLWNWGKCNKIRAQKWIGLLIWHQINYLLWIFVSEVVKQAFHLPGFGKIVTALLEYCMSPHISWPPPPPPKCHNLQFSRSTHIVRWPSISQMMNEENCPPCSWIWWLDLWLGKLHLHFCAGSLRQKINTISGASTKLCFSLEWSVFKQGQEMFLFYSTSRLALKPTEPLL
jgi:hypothetical protein